MRDERTGDRPVSRKDQFLEGLLVRLEKLPSADHRIQPLAACSASKLERYFAAFAAGTPTARSEDQQSARILQVPAGCRTRTIKYFPRSSRRWPIATGTSILQRPRSRAISPITSRRSDCISTSPSPASSSEIRNSRIAGRLRTGGTLERLRERSAAESSIKSSMCLLFRPCPKSWTTWRALASARPPAEVPGEPPPAE